ncbi:endonuclease V family protein [Mycobacterium xenopi 4042]|uniref:Endonuclease V family protein n=1 Tax=Mycobacterium xenopi 4042 TaxID=1299334 RepID=X8BH28_MYCXE|nr:endonuclease V family protein [Mycobacterium xenopi 4042]
MLIAVDVQYGELAVVTAAVGFTTWSDPTSTLECVFRTAVTAQAYRPGAFYKRELPFLLEAVALVQRRHPVATVVIDGHVWLREGQPGLGARLYQALDARTAVIGVAKGAFAGGNAIPVRRGSSSRPLFVTAAGMDAHDAAELVRGMHGPHRVPTLLKRADRLARGHAAPTRRRRWWAGRSSSAVDAAKRLWRSRSRCILRRCDRDRSQPERVGLKCTDCG